VKNGMVWAKQKKQREKEQREGREEKLTQMTKESRITPQLRTSYRDNSRGPGGWKWG